MKYRWLLFDLDNTLIDFKHTSHKALEASFKHFNLKLTEEAYNTYKTINADVWKAFEKNEIDAISLRRKRFADTLSALSIDGIDPLDFNKAYMQYLVDFSYAYEGVLPFLKELKKDYKISIITNGLKEAQRPRLKITQLYDLFDSIVVSDEIGIAKPDKAFFDYTLQSLKHNFDKSEILVIGDNLNSDILGAQNAKLPSCWISQGKENSSKIIPTHSISHVLELTQVLTH